MDWEPQPVGRSQQSLVTSSDSRRVILTEGGGLLAGQFYGHCPPVKDLCV